jgi:pimeloyl-ACP methyl ester carboxylesterase
LKREINGFLMNYDDIGSGPAILLIHGFPLDRTMWTYQVDALSDNYRVITPDLRGHGKSEPVPGPYTMDGMAEDLHALLAQLDVSRVVLAGLSMGGYIAFAFWRLFPQQVRALVLADTRSAADTSEGRKARYAMIERVQVEGSEAIVDGMLPALLSAPTLENKPEVVAQTRRMMANTPKVGVIGALQGMAERPDSTPTLATISVPTLITVGEEDAITPPIEAEAMQQAIMKGGQDHSVVLARIGNAGHLAPLENPAAFNGALLNFLASLGD